MVRRRCSILTAFIAALVVSAPAARADQIGFAYDFTTPQAVTGDGGNLGTIAFATTNGGTATGPSVTVTAASLTAVSAALNSNPDTFSGETYNVTLALTDTASGKRGSLTFVGKLSGSLTATAANITTSFATPTKMLVLGNDSYTVTIGPLVPPITVNPTVVGTLMAKVNVQAGAEEVAINDPSPEPSAFVLAGIGLVAAAIKRRGRAMSVAA